MSKSNRISATDLPPRYQAQVAKQLYPIAQMKAAGLDPTPAKKRLRQSSKPLMNKLEEAFYGHLLRTIPREMIFPQAIRLEISNGHWYKPDFFVCESPLVVRGTAFQEFPIRARLA